MADRDAVIQAAAQKAFEPSEPAVETKQPVVEQEQEVAEESTDEEIPLDLDEVKESTEEVPTTSNKARELFEAGNIEEAFKEAFGKPPSFFKIDDTKFAAFRRQEKAAWKEVDEAREGIDKALHLNEKAKEALKAEWGGIAEGIKAGKQGDVYAVVNAAAKMANMDPVELVKAYVKEVKKIDNRGATVTGNETYEKRIKDLEEKLANKGKETEQTPEDRTAKLNEAYEYIAEKLEDHDVAKLKGYAKAVYAEIAAVYKKTNKKISEEQAADRIVARKKKEVEALGFLKPEEKPARKSNKTRTGTAPRPDTASMSRDEQIAAAARAAFGRGK